MGFSFVIYEGPLFRIEHRCNYSELINLEECLIRSNDPSDESFVQFGMMTLWNNEPYVQFGLITLQNNGPYVEVGTILTN